MNEWKEFAKEPPPEKDKQYLYGKYDSNGDFDWINCVPKEVFSHSFTHWLDLKSPPPKPEEKEDEFEYLKIYTKNGHRLIEDDGLDPPYFFSEIVRLDRFVGYLYEDGVIANIPVVYDKGNPFFNTNVFMKDKINNIKVIYPTHVVLKKSS